MRRTFFEQPVLVISFSLALVIASTEAPLWMGSAVFGLLFWKWLIERQGIFKPSRKFTAFLSIFLLLQVYLHYRAIFTQEASNTLLVGLSALKIVDYENERDHQFLILLGFIMVSMKFIFNIDFYWIFPSLISFTGLWSSLLPLNYHQKSKFLIRLLLASLPVALMLFFAFPRIIVPWAMSRSTPLNQIGFSDHLNPGSVAELALENRLAFRAKFFNKIQTSNSLYWRGSVLTRSAGLQWSPPPLKRDRRPYRKSPHEFSYEVVLEPGSKGYLFTLAQSKKLSSEMISFNEYRYSVYRTRDLRKPSAYRAISDEEIKDTEPPHKLFLQTPTLPPKAQHWVKEVERGHQSPESRLKALETLFSDPRFVYTLKPGTYGHADIDEFLFERRKGFCEHFAGAYATLARALGIPTRVITGYQGGTYNVFGNFWRVSQRDAHAWVEIFTKGAWERVDPTEWVAPLRLTLGGESFFNLPEIDQISFARSSMWNSPGASGVSVLDAFTLWIDNLNYMWTHFMLEFDSQTQRDFWTDITKEIGLFIGIVFILVLISLLIMKRLLSPSVQRDPIQKIFDQVVKWGESHGIIYEKNLSPLLYLKKLEMTFPLHASIFKSIYQTYDEEIYGFRKYSDSDIEKLKKKWLRIKAKPLYKS